MSVCVCIECVCVCESVYSVVRAYKSVCMCECVSV